MASGSLTVISYPTLEPAGRLASKVARYGDGSMVNLGDSSLTSNKVIVTVTLYSILRRKRKSHEMAEIVN